MTKTGVIWEEATTNEKISPEDWATKLHQTTPLSQILTISLHGLAYIRELLAANGDQYKKKNPQAIKMKNFRTLQYIWLRECWRRGTGKIERARGSGRLLWDMSLSNVRSWGHDLIVYEFSSIISILDFLIEPDFRLSMKSRWFYSFYFLLLLISVTSFIYIVSSRWYSL